MKIGIYGGSFDPVHTGHAMVANFVSQCNVVDEVWMMVSRKNPLKLNSTMASDAYRVAMVEIVASGGKNIRVTDIEMDMPVPSFTIESLKKLKSTYPEHDFKLIIGSDSLEKFGQWKNWEQILKDFGVIVYPRPGYPMPETEPAGMTFLNGAPEFSISSSLIREYISSGWNINYFVPSAVVEYINLHKLYQ